MSVADHEHQWQDTGFATVEDCAVEGCVATRSGGVVREERWHEEHRDAHPDMRYVETVQVKWLRDRLANIEELHSVRKRTVEGHVLRWCRECQQDWPCPTVELAGGDDDV